MLGWFRNLCQKLSGCWWRQSRERKIEAFLFFEVSVSSLLPPSLASLVALLARLLLAVNLKSCSIIMLKIINLCLFMFPAISNQTNLEPRATRYALRATHHTPRATHRTPRATRHAPHATHHTPRTTRPTPHTTRHTQCATRNAPHANRQSAIVNHQSPTTNRQAPPATHQSPTNLDVTSEQRWQGSP